MTKKKAQGTARGVSGTAERTYFNIPVPAGVLAWLGYFVITAILTFPLIFKMNSSVYGFYDHISTDLFANINFYFWHLKRLVFDYKTSPLVTPLFAAPFGARMNLVNLTGFVQLPITVIFGYLFSRNFTILFNLVVSAAGMFYLVRHLTKNDVAAFIAGIVFAFCPNMLVRSYTTFDSTQVQWIPLYTLFVIRFIENRTWKNALLAGVFLACNILFTIPYFLVFLPVHTIVLLAVYAIWRAWGEHRGFGGLIRDLTSPSALAGWMKIAAALALVVVVFLVYYKTVVGTDYVSSVQRTTQQLEELAQKPSDYFMPHPRSALLKGNIKESYWNTKRPGKDPDSFVAYIGYISLALAVFGFIQGRKRVSAWMFLAAALVALWATLGPKLFGIPTPSGLIHALYASFARRILIYKVFVQFGVAGLAGIGAAQLLERTAFNQRGFRTAVTAGICAVILAEYSLVPPALSVDLTETPEIYQKVKELPENTILLEAPLRRSSGNLFQGYVYYQTYHEKPLFNPYFGLALVPEQLRPLYKQMEVPLEAQEYSNLASLRYLGVTHIVYHWFVGTQTVMFRTYSAPGFVSFDKNRISFGEIEGLDRVYTNKSDPMSNDFKSPYDYTFANLYTITAEPCPVALTFDYHSPYDPAPGLLDRDGMSEYGWQSALVDTTATMYYPLAHEGRLVRLLRQGGKVTATNCSENPVTFDITFTATAPDSGRVIETRWSGGSAEGSFAITVGAVRCNATGLMLGPGESGELSIWSTKPAYPYPVDLGGMTVNIPTTTALSDFRVQMR